MIKRFFRDHKIHRSIVKKIDWLFVFNLPYFFVLWMLFVWGMSASYYSNSLNDKFYFLTYFDLYQFIFFFGLTILLGGLNINSQLDDLIYILDWQKNNNKYTINLDYLYVCPNFVDTELVRKYSYICIFTGFIITIIFSFYCFIALLLYSIFNLFLHKYIIQTISFKQFMLRCLFRLCNVFLLFLSGWIYFGVYSLINIISYIPLFIMAVLPIILMNEIICYNQYSDKESNRRLFINENKRSIALLSLIIMVCLFLCSFYLMKVSDPITSHFSIITIPFLMYTFLRSSDKDYLRSFKYPIMIMNVLLSWTLFPFLFLAQFVVYYISKYYYWHRFNIHFPKFVMEEND